MCFPLMNLIQCITNAFRNLKPQQVAEIVETLSLLGALLSDLISRTLRRPSPLSMFLAIQNYAENLNIQH